MRIFVEGDKSKIICSHCKGWVNTTFKCRDVSFSDGSGIVKGILAAVCDTCGQVVATSPQSTPEIKLERTSRLI